MLARWLIFAAVLGGCGPAGTLGPTGGADDPVDVGGGAGDGGGDDGDPPEDGDDGGAGDDEAWPDPDPEADAALDALLDERREAAGFPGLAVAIVKGGRLVWAGAYGWADVENARPVTTDTVFLLASVSKTFVATAAMQLVEEGVLDLDDDVSASLRFDVGHPDFPDVPITLRMLLTHTSSLRDDWDVFLADVVDGDSPVALGDFLYGYVGDRAHYDAQGPGATWEYSNAGTDLAAYVVEAVVGIGFDEHCEENIFAPLGMDETSWHLAGLDESNLAVPYDDAGWPLAHYGYPGYPDGALRTSAPQLARFLAAFAGGGEVDGVRILEHATVEEIMREQLPEVAPDQGLIWYWWDDGYGRLIGHSGGDLGAATLMALRPEDGVGTILLTNGNWDPDPDALFEMQARLFEESPRF
jgi:CubicO group peptidase (beta-lactamase class C family)